MMIFFTYRAYFFYPNYKIYCMVLWATYLCPSLKFICWNPNSQYDSGTSGDVIRPWGWSHPERDLCPSKDRCWRSWSWMVLWRPTRPFRTNTQKRCPFHYRGLEYKSRKSRNTWSNRHIWPWNTEWSRAKTNRVLPRKCTGHSKHPLPTTQEKTTHGHHQMINTEIRLIIFFATKDGEAVYNHQKQDWELTVAQIMNSLLPISDLNWRK